MRSSGGSSLCQVIRYGKHALPTPQVLTAENTLTYSKRNWALGKFILVYRSLKDNSTMYRTEAQIVSYGILYLNPSSHQCQPSYKKYIAV